MPLLISLEVKRVFGVESRVIEMRGVGVEQVIGRLRGGVFEDLLSFVIISPGEGVRLLDMGVVAGIKGCDDRTLDYVTADIAYYVGMAMGLGRCGRETCVMSGTGDLLCRGCSERLRFIIRKLSKNS